MFVGIGPARRLGDVDTGPGGPLHLEVDFAREGYTSVTFQGLTQHDRPWIEEGFIFG